MKRLTFTLLLSFAIISTFAQTYLFNSSTTAITTCAGTLYDNGGSASNYTGSQVNVLTLTPSTPGTAIQILFTQWNVAAGTTLEIFDGPTTASPILGFAYDNANNPVGTQIMASLSNTTGQLTLRWTSGSAVSNGFTATLGCHTPCQNILVTIDSNNCVPAMSANYIDVCFGDLITFSAFGSYPENGTAYTQSDATSLFIWEFGDGTSDTGQVVQHLYATASGFDFSVRVEDIEGCKSTNYEAGRVRHSNNPIVDIKPLPDICASDTIDVSVGLNALSTIVIDQTQGGASGTLELADTTFLPDGSGVSYTSDLVYDVFATGATLSSINDLLGVCLNMEHTYMGDLKIVLLCPNGSSTVLLDYSNSGGGTIIGEPVGSGLPVDDNTSNTTPGIGYDYCFSPTSTNGYIDASSNWTYLSSYTDPIGQTSSGIYQATAGTYQAEGVWGNLIGCPLNGTWTIRVTDNLSADNGYIFSWGLSLNPALIPGGWEYTVPIDSVTWSGPSIYETSDSTAAIVPDTNGTFDYTMTIYDAFGCSYDTTFSVEVLANPDPDLGNDTIACEGATILLDGGPGTSYFWTNSTSSTTQTIVAETTGIYSVYVSNSNGSVTCYGADTIDITIVPWASVDLGADQCVPSGPVVLDAQNPGFNYDWSSGASTQTIDVTSTGTYSVSVSYGPYEMCGDDDEVQITIIPTANLDLGADLEMCAHEYRVIEATQSSTQYTYLWSTGATTPYITVEDVPLGTHTYTVTISGCDDISDTINVNVIACDLTVPNVITPGNGDGANDVFEVTNLNYYPNSVLVVFNRWGKKVYENSNYQNDWDGEDCASGTYYYILKVNYGNEEYQESTGTITILRAD